MPRPGTALVLPIPLSACHGETGADRAGSPHGSRGNADSRRVSTPGQACVSTPLLHRGIDRFIARQPIFDHNQHVIGYELLYRSGWNNSFSPGSMQVASRSLADTAILHGVDLLTSSTRAFINCTREDLLEGVICVFPPSRTVVEILETVAPEPEILEACRQLKKLGYQVAVDDFAGDSHLMPLIEVADIVKVGWLAAPRDLRESLPGRLPKHRLLAEKIETPEEFEEAKQAGYHWFQGYFFARPRVMAVRDIPAFQVNYVRALRAANQAALDFAEIEKSVKQEPSLLYRLLRYLNSPLFGFRQPIVSISHALALLGEKKLRRWISVVCFAVLAGDKPQELVRTSLIRARFCELLAARVGMKRRAPELFLLGLLSLLDALLDRPMGDVLREIPVHRDLADALRGSKTTFRSILDAVRSYECGDWEEWRLAASELPLAEAEIPPIFLASLEWADQALEACRLPSA